MLTFKDVKDYNFNISAKRSRHLFKINVTCFQEMYGTKVLQIFPATSMFSKYRFMKWIFKYVFEGYWHAFSKH